MERVKAVIFDWAGAIDLPKLQTKQANRGHASAPFPRASVPAVQREMEVLPA